MSGVARRRVFGVAWRFVAAFFGSFLVALVVFVLVLVGPVWVIMAFIGRQDVLDSPGHGAAIVLLTGPLALIAGCVSWAVAGGEIYDRLSTRK